MLSLRKGRRVKTRVVKKSKSVLNRQSFPSCNVTYQPMILLNALLTKFTTTSCGCCGRFDNRPIRRPFRPIAPRPLDPVLALHGTYRSGSPMFRIRNFAQQGMVDRIQRTRLFRQELDICSPESKLRNDLKLEIMDFGERMQHKRASEYELWLARMANLVHILSPILAT
jgi:hypothetical protein